MAELDSLFVDEIVVGDRLRPLNRETVERLKESIAKIGLKTPLSVKAAGDEGYLLVAGLHRLQAAKELGLKQVPIRIERGDEIDARMWEIAENLHRAELTVAERAGHIAEWVRLTEDKAAQVAQVSNKGGRGLTGGLSAATRDLGIDRTEAQRAIKIDAIAPEAKAEARVLHLDDNQSALLKAARQPSKEAQIRVLREHAMAREHPRAAQSPARDPLNDIETVERQVDALIAAWNRAGPEARERFLERIDNPVADNTSALRA